MKRRVRTGFLVAGVLIHVTIASAGAGILVNRHALDRPADRQAVATARSSDAPPQGACVVTVTERDRWQTGFTAGLVVTNRGEALNGWELRFTSPGVRVLHGWNGVWTQQGDEVIVRNMATNAALAAGASTTMSLSAALTGQAQPPRDFTLNGVDCA